MSLINSFLWIVKHGLETHLWTVGQSLTQGLREISDQSIFFTDHSATIAVTLIERKKCPIFLHSEVVHFFTRCGTI